MSLVSAEGELIQLCGKAGLGGSQRALLEAVLAASNPEAVLTRHASSEPTGVAAIARAHSALESRARPGRTKAQPYEDHALILVEAALEALKVVRLHVPAGGLDRSVRELGSIKAGGTAGLRSVADCRAKAELVEVTRARRARSRRRRIHRGMAGTRGGGHWTTARARDRCPVHHGRPPALPAQR